MNTSHFKLSDAQRHALICAYSGWHPIPLYSKDREFGVRMSTLSSLFRNELVRAHSTQPGDVRITAQGEAALGLKPMISADFDAIFSDAVGVFMPEYFAPDSIIAGENLHTFCDDSHDGYDIKTCLDANRMLGGLDLEKGNYVRFFDNGIFDVLLACVCQRLREFGFETQVEFYPAQIVFVRSSP